MEKPASLRQCLTEAFPDIFSNPENLIVLVENGKIIAQADTLNCKQAYELTMAVLDFTGQPDQVFVVINNWLQTNQPDLLRNPDKAKDDYQFEAELIDHDKYDLTIKLRLTEDIIVKTDANGQRTITSRQEPSRLNFFAD